MNLLLLPWHTECSRAGNTSVLYWTKLLLLLPWHTECSRAGNASVLGGTELVDVVARRAKS
jgi:hypothetical protein